MSEENTSVIWGSEGVQNHTFSFGRSGKGKSAIIMQQAKAEGISYEEMEERLKPTKEQEAAWEKERQAEEQKAAKRLQLIRDAYWDNSPTSDFDSIHRTIDHFFDVEPTVEQLRAIFNLLPATIVGAGIQWGFDDTEVRNQIFEFIGENKELVSAALNIEK